MTDRVVATKTPPAHYSDHATFQQRFRRKAQATAKLNSPHVMPHQVDRFRQARSVKHTCGFVYPPAGE